MPPYGMRSTIVFSNNATELVFAVPTNLTVESVAISETTNRVYAVLMDVGKVAMSSDGKRCEGFYD